jgi:hypothetical protein
MMRDDVKDLIAQVKGDDTSAHEDAILKLMYRMEDSTRHIAKNDMIGDIYLSQDEQLELIDALIELTESLRPEYSGLLWVIGKADPIVMIDPVQNFVLKYANTMPSNMLRQSLVALLNCFRVPEGSNDEAVVKGKFKYEQLKAKLRAIKTQDEILLRDDILQDTLLCMDAFYTQ